MKNRYDVIIIGSGAAGFGTAEWLHRFGMRNICILTEDVMCGTSRNAGSDKQTYYKVDFSGDSGDSVKAMAKDLFAGGSMNGSDALIEAAASIRCFMRLVELGVPFPEDKNGLYPGYRTDHDSTERATSAGPLTSKYMTEALEKSVRARGIPVLDGYQVIRLITENGECRGAVCLKSGKIRNIYSDAVILCTGAPAAVYARSVYPIGQVGATGLAIEAGAELANFQEWQYGIASTKFRWNLSGSYQQVIPRYFSFSPDGTEREFLIENRNKDEIYSKIFLKGYQWPFDSAKSEGSSEIDLLISRELEKGNRVFMDYRRDPEGFDFDALSEEAKKYLTDTESLGETPFERLEKLNPGAIKLYHDHGIELATEPLEIGVCAQHNNGGIRTDGNGETSVKGLFAVGEASGKFGVYRPGGSALNDTQTGGLRAAKYLAGKAFTASTLKKAPHTRLPVIGEKSNLSQISSEFAVRMSDFAGVYREYEKVSELLDDLRDLEKNYYSRAVISDASEIPEFFRLRQTVISQRALCETIKTSIENIGSRGGCICIRSGKIVTEKKKFRKYITVTSADGVSFDPVDNIPDEKNVFEKLLKGSVN